MRADPISLQTYRSSFPSFKQCEHAWSYLGKIVIMSRNILNASSRNLRIVSYAGQNFPQRIKQITNHMKLCAFVSVFFGLFDLQATASKVLKSIQIKDREGIAINILTTALIAVDIFETSLTFLNSALSIFSKDQVLSNIGLPLGLSIAAMATANRIIHLSKVVNLYLSIQRNKQNLEPFLKEKFASEIEKASLLRASNFEVLNELQAILNDKTYGTDEILNRVENLLKKKIHVELIGLASFLIMGFALTLMRAGNSGAKPFLLLALSFKLRIGSLLYQEI